MGGMTVPVLLSVIAVAMMTSRLPMMVAMVWRTAGLAVLRFVAVASGFAVRLAVIAVVMMTTRFAVMVAMLRMSAGLAVRFPVVAVWFPM